MMTSMMKLLTMTSQSYMMLMIWQRMTQQPSIYTLISRRITRKTSADVANPKTDLLFCYNKFSVVTTFCNKLSEIKEVVFVEYH